MLNKWEFNCLPTEKDPTRWRLKLKISEEDLDGAISPLPGNKGKPFLVEDGTYDFGVYFYNLSEADHDKIKSSLEQKCPDGKTEGYRAVGGDFFSDLADKIESAAPAAGHHRSPKPADTKDAVHSPPVSPPPPSAPSPSAFSFIVEDMPLNPEYVFDQFVVGPNNRFTHAAALAVAKAPGKTYNPFFIHGGVGLGKTHLMQSVGHYVAQNFSNLKVVYITTEKFVADVIDAISRGEGNALRNFYKTVDVLLVDDIQSLSQSESTQDEFFHIFNLLHQNKKQIVITCDRPPKLLTVLEDRLRSRFEWGLIADIKSPSLETRVAILKKKEEGENLSLDDNILLYIASKLKSNVRELEGFLKRITAYSTLTKQEVDINLVKTLMAELLPSEENPDITVAQAQGLKPPPTMPPQTIPQQQIPMPEPVETAPVDNLRETDIKIVPKGQAAASASPPSSAQQIPVPPPVSSAPSVPVDATLKPVDVVFFFPSGHDKELSKVKDKFTEVIKKHKLKFRLVSVFDRPYETKGKINYAIFTELCKTNKVGISVVLSPPPETGVKEDEFSNVLGAMMSDEKISLQLVPWNEINKDYRYLNLALDITLSSTGG